MSSRKIFLPSLHADGHQTGESLLQVIRGAFAVRKDHKTGGNTGRGKQKNEKTEYEKRGAKGARPEMERAGKKLNMDISADAAGRTGAGCRKRQRRRSADARDQWTRLDTRKEYKKLNTDISARRGAEAVGAAGVGGESSFQSKICSNC